VKALAMRVAVPLVQRTPGLGYLVAELAAAAMWVLRSSLRRQAIANLAPFVGSPRAARRASFQAFLNVGRYYVDLALIPRRDPRTFERQHVYVETPERLPSVEQPGPVIFVSAHYGNPDQLVQFLTSRRPTFTAVVERLEPPAVHRLLERLRSSHGGEFVEADLKGTRRCLERLRAGEPVAIVGDRDLTGRGVCVTLAGRRVKLPRGPWELARRTGAPVVPVFLRRLGRSDFAAWIGEPIPVSREGEHEEAVAAAVCRWAAVLEEQIRRDPGQWLVLEDFWEAHRCGES
jgi:lauroyl/myristoyl acyltransferase